MRCYARAEAELGGAVIAKDCVAGATLEQVKAGSTVDRVAQSEG